MTRLFVPAETAEGETRVAATPETVKAYLKLGLQVAVEPGAGVAAGFPDEEYAEAGAEIADYIQYATANAAAKKLMSDKYLNNPGIFPSDETIAKCEPSIYLGEEATKARDEAWTRIQAA